MISSNHATKFKIPGIFSKKKAEILALLDLPDEQYNDASPKGSVDTGILPLIHYINNLDGLVTTSSCAGRISVFLEGIAPSAYGPSNVDATNVKSTNYTDIRRNDNQVIEAEENNASRTNTSAETATLRPQSQKAVPGGKGNGGHWLFVSHDPMTEEQSCSDLISLFGLDSSQPHKSFSKSPSPSSKRLVRFQFEPMILHVLCASLHHAQDILAAAISSGFRESGLQSLKSLQDENSLPMVAVRTAGLAFESLIAIADSSGIISRFSSQAQLQELIEIANARFEANSDRMQKFWNALRLRFDEQSRDWEPASIRRERKIAAGLARRQAHTTHSTQCESAQTEDILDFDKLFCEVTTIRNPAT